MPDAPSRVLIYDGKLGELYRIFLLNLLLTIATLGVWRFWAVTRIRRYLWSRTSFDGDRFEYDGTGGQLFVGFLLAALVIGGLFAGAGIVSFLLHGLGPVVAVLPIFAAEGVVFVLALGAPFSAQRYRLGHTLWRGIRGGMQGSMLGYGLRSVGYFLLSVLTLYQLHPWASLRLIERRINASGFGNARFSARGQAGQIYLMFLLTLLARVVFAAIVFGTTYEVLRPLLATIAHLPKAEAARVMQLRLLPAFVAAGLVFGFGAMLISASYAASFYRHVTARTTLADLRFASAVSGLDIVKLLVGNALIVLLTLGLGLPLVIHRNARFFTTNLLATGTIDAGALLQGEGRASRYGEGMFQVLDAGTGIG